MREIPIEFSPSSPGGIEEEEVFSRNKRNVAYLGRIDFGEALDDGENSVDDLLFGEMIVVGGHKPEKSGGKGKWVAMSVRSLG